MREMNGDGVESRERLDICFLLKQRRNYWKKGNTVLAVLTRARIGNVEIETEVGSRIRIIWK